MQEKDIFAFFLALFVDGLSYPLVLVRMSSFVLPIQF